MSGVKSACQEYDLVSGNHLLFLVLDESVNNNNNNNNTLPRLSCLRLLGFTVKSQDVTIPPPVR